MEPDPPPIDTLKMKAQFTKSAFTDEQAEALVGVVIAKKRGLIPNPDACYRSFRIV